MAAFGGRLRMRDDIQHKAETIALTVPSHPKYLYVIRSMLYPIVVEAGFSKKESRTIVLAVDEACSNIIKYAYEGDHSKLIVLTIVVEKTKLVIELKDSGKKIIKYAYEGDHSKLISPERSC